MSYQEYLQSPVWKRKRSQKIVAEIHRGKVQCSDCRQFIDYRAIEVHHETYARVGAERLSDLTILCSACHALRHDKLDIVGRAPLPEVHLSGRKMNDLRNAVLNELENLGD